MISDRRLQISHLVQPPNTENPVVFRFKEHGRDYYAYKNAAIYPFPCDENESERLDTLHCLIHDEALKGRLVNADLNVHVSHRLQILDVGYGTGIWAYEMAKSNAHVDVLGIDLFGTEPTRNDAIPNVQFETPLNFTDTNWHLREGYFDLIRMSQLCGCVPDWLQQYSTAFRYLRPGSGFLEHIEIDWAPRCTGQTGLPPELGALQHWWSDMLRASSRLGRSVAYRDDTQELLENAGFTDINHQTIRINLQWSPQDERDSRLKRWFISIMCGDRQGNIRPSFEALTMSLFTRQLSMCPEEVHSRCNAVRAAYYTNRAPLYHNLHIWTARKPMS